MVCGPAWLPEARGNLAAPDAGSTYSTATPEVGGRATPRRARDAVRRSQSRAPGLASRRGRPMGAALTAASCPPPRSGSRGRVDPLSPAAEERSPRPRPPGASPGECGGGPGPWDGRPGFSGQVGATEGWGSSSPRGCVGWETLCSCAFLHTIRGAVAVPRSAR